MAVLFEPRAERFSWNCPGLGSWYAFQLSSGSCIQLKGQNDGRLGFKYQAAWNTGANFELYGMLVQIVSTVSSTRHLRSRRVRYPGTKTCVHIRLGDVHVEAKPSH